MLTIGAGLPTIEAIGQVQAFIPEDLDLGNSCLCRGDMDNGATTLRPLCTFCERTDD